MVDSVQFSVELSVELTTDGSGETRWSSRHQASRADIRRIGQKSAVEQASNESSRHQVVEMATAAKKIQYFIATVQTAYLMQ